MRQLFYIPRLSDNYSAQPHCARGLRHMITAARFVRLGWKRRRIPHHHGRYWGGY